MQDDPAAVLTTVIDDSIALLAETRAAVDLQEFASAVDRLGKADRVLVLGWGPAGALAEYLALHLHRLGCAATADPRTGVGLADSLSGLRDTDMHVLIAPLTRLREIDVALDQAEAVGAGSVLAVVDCSAHDIVPQAPSAPARTTTPPALPTRDVDPPRPSTSPVRPAQGRATRARREADLRLPHGPRLPRLAGAGAVMLIPPATARPQGHSGNGPRLRRVRTEGPVLRCVSARNDDPHPDAGAIAAVASRRSLDTP